MLPDFNLSGLFWFRIFPVLKSRDAANINKLFWRPPQYARPCKLTFGLLTLKVVFESRVTWTTSMPILVFLGFSVLDLGPMYATDRQTSDSIIDNNRTTSGKAVCRSVVHSKSSMTQDIGKTPLTYLRENDRI